MLKKWFGLFLVLALLFLAAGCSKKTEDPLSGETPGEAEEFTGGSREEGTTGGEIPDEASASKDSIKASEEAAGAEGSWETKTEAEGSSGDGSDVGDVLPDEASFSSQWENRQEIQAGLLTAGEWCDNLNWDFLVDLVENQNANLPVYQINPMKRLAVHVETKQKQPVADAEVVLLDQAGNILWKAVSDYSGYAYVFYDVFQSSRQQNMGAPYEVKVRKKKEEAAKRVVPAWKKDVQGNPAKGILEDISITLEEDSKTTHLDVMFLFDTTGSMGDELSYLQREFEDIARRIGDENTSFSVNFYRDQGDEYVLDTHEFTKDIKQVSKVLREQAAGGGGDYEEVLDQALQDGICHKKWSKDSTKLLFLILDAPPHKNQQVFKSLQDSIKEAAAKGIRIIPIASSGIDKDTEFLLRSFAILTGGTYTFLTDHSGIGNSHLEPTIGSYEVEPLNECIIRLVNQYHIGMIACY